MDSICITIRTANRAPKRNYLGMTVRQFAGHRVHLFPTDPDIGWLLLEVGDVQVTIHVPEKRLRPNENGIRQVEALQEEEADWIAMFEDDIETCADPVGSIQRWLADHARPDIAVYRLFALPNTPVILQRPGYALSPLREMRGSQAVIMRNIEARYFAHWAKAHPTDWRPAGAPFSDRPDKGFDKLIGYWALQYRKNQHNGMVSRPMMVRHVGRESVMYSHGLTNDREFAGKQWRYYSVVAV